MGGQLSWEKKFDTFGNDRMDIHYFTITIKRRHSGKTVVCQLVMRGVKRRHSGKTVVCQLAMRGVHILFSAGKSDKIMTKII